MAENFEDIDRESFLINNAQRLLLVGFSIDSSLSRMIEWLSNNYDLIINAVLLKYVKTSKGNELISRAAIIPEDVEKDKIDKRKNKIEMSDEKGTYDANELKVLFSQYLNRDLRSSKRIKCIMLPFLLSDDKVIPERN